MRFLASPAFRVLGLGVGLFICGSALPAAPVSDGAALFQQKCAMCHGADGKGFAAIKTPDFTDPKWQASATDKEIAEVIKNGKKGTPMPAFGGKLKEEDIQALVRYIRSFDSSKRK
ncbi:MAG: cytochrome c [Terriglobia bacterium]|jgi:cbb3-type cytochrome c oxidase subunit III